MLSYLTNLVRPVSPWSLKVEEPSLLQLTDLDSLPEFAQAVAQRLQSEAAQLTPGPDVPGVALFKGVFCSFLQSVPEYLNGLPHRSHQNRLITLLSCWEALCQWPNPAEFSCTREAGAKFSACQYPALKSLLESRSSVKAKLVQFAGAKSLPRRDKAANALWQDMINAFNALSAPESESKGPDLSELTKLATSKEDLEDNQSFALQLYDALSQHFRPDRCPYDWKSTVVNLRLNWWELSKADDTLCFALFVMINEMAKSNDSATHCYWQDLQVCVSKMRQVAFDVPSHRAPNLLGPVEDSREDCLPSAEDTSRGSGDTDHISSPDENEADELCQYLAKRTVAQYRFEYATGFKLQMCNQPERSFRRDSMGIRLDDLIGTGKLGDKMKLSLSFVLVRTFWQYCESDWMQDYWSKESIYFMFDMVDCYPKVISIHEPFLQARFNKSDHGDKMGQSTGPSKSSNRKKKFRNTSHGTKVRTRTHQYPKLLALGITLLEIELDRKLESLTSRAGEDSDIVNIRHSMATKVLNNQDLWPPKDIWKLVKESIEICIKADTEVLGNVEEDLRHNFYRKVVGPFKAFMALAWSDADYQRMDSVTIDNAPPSHSPSAQNSAPVNLLQADEADREATISNTFEASSSAARIMYGSPPYAGIALTSVNSIPGTDGSGSQIGTTMSAQSPFTSTDWFAKLDDLNDVLKIRQRNRDEHSRLVKVAILDTGVQEAYYQNDQSSIKSIKDYKDFLSGNDNIRQDGVGHGTLCVRLLQKVYEHAEIYVGRVFKTKDATPETKKYMEIAIKHAICKKQGWGVDVVCIPSGFESEYLPITNVISNAKPSKVLIFAAASNYGNTGGVYFPAWLSRSFDLFCLFSTTASAKPTCEFNPAPMDSAYNFAILGEDIQLPNTKSLSGTSFSTIIAAGIAAQIIDFSMQPDIRNVIGCNEILRQVDGMSAIFARMSTRENKYHCLTPWVLLDGMTVQEYDEKDIRLAICRTISNALRSRHKTRV